MEESTSYALPLTTLLSRAPTHPLVQLITSPLTPRVAFLESHLLLSPPASILRRLHLGSRSILFLAALGIGAVGTRWRQQWRVALGVAGVAEAVGQSLGLLAALEAGKEVEEAAEQVKRLVSFWLFFASLSLSESLVASSPSTPLRPPPFLRPFLRSLPLPRTRTRFPQPAPFPLPRPTRQTTRLHPLLKLLLLWTALRPDIGASAVWDYLLGPLFAVQADRGKGKPSARVVLFPPPPSSPARKDDVRPYTLPSSPNASYIDDEEDPDATADSTSPSPTPSPRVAQGFPTPEHIPYTLTSMMHPIHARLAAAAAVGGTSALGSGSTVRGGSDEGGRSEGGAVKGVPEGWGWTE